MRFREIMQLEKKILCKSRYYFNNILFLWVFFIIVSVIPISMLCDYNYEKYNILLYTWFITVGITIIAALVISPFIIRNEVKVTLTNAVNHCDIFLLDKSLRLSLRTPFPYNYMYPLANFNYLTKRVNKFKDKDKIPLYGINTFHANGYKREKALIDLIKYNTGNELKFIIVRVNDWVKEIHKIAKFACLERINQMNIQEVYNNLPNLLRLNDMKRYDHSDILERVKQLFLDETNKDYLLKGLQDTNPKVRSFFSLFINQHIKEQKSV